MVSVLEGQRVTCHVLEQALAYFERYGVCAEVLYGSGATADSILAAAQDKQCDLLILGGYDRWNLKDLLLGGVLEKLLFRFNRTVLICN
jgi:nucleotide-binding universal stress UspA family protein